jgi:opacity protein-like surface antigen
VLFVTSQLSERISVLSEVSFNNSEGQFNFEVQRLALRYYVKDYFSVRVGKMFTPIGYWNNQFTLGLVLQPTIQRPFAIRPVSSGGVLQFRDTGIQFEGENITPARFFYKILLANGVGYHGSNDKGDSHIATTVQVGAEPIEGLKVIGSGMFDRIEEGKANPNGTVVSLPDNGNLSLLVGSVAYMNPEKKAEFIFEYLAQKSNFDNITDTKSHSYYGYAGYKVTDKITPYVLYNSTQAGKSKTESDPYFSPIPVKLELLTLGVRYKFNSSFVCKLEYEMNNEKFFYGDIIVPDGTGGTIKLDDGFTNEVKSNSVRVQLAFVF